jgi:hypothetical protein
LETVQRLQAEVRRGATYQRSLALLAAARELAPQIPTKSGLMLGLGETREDVVEALLFKDEAELPDGGIEGDPAFQTAFTKRAPKSSDGRSLKDFQLLNRLFKLRCSYMIYSLTFQHLTAPLKQTVLSRLWAVLEGKDTTGSFTYLTETERAHIRRILAETLPGAPAEWKKTLVAK